MITAAQFKKFKEYEAFVKKCQWLCQSQEHYNYQAEINKVIEEARSIYQEPAAAPAKQYVYIKRTTNMFSDAIVEVSRGTSPEPSEDEEYMITLTSEDADNMEMNGKDPAEEVNMLEYVRERFQILTEQNYEIKIID